MGNTLNSRAQIQPEPGSITTRRSFIAAASLGAVSLYGLWAVLGAAPLRFWQPGEPMEMPATGGGHEGHGAMQGPTPDEFRKMTDEFLARYRQPDGSILVEPDTATQSMAGMTMAQGEAPPPVDVFIAAQQWSFDPAELRLRTGIPYRFKMMAVDAAHGASLQLGLGSQIVRLPKGIIVESQLTFTEPGIYVLYCTSYCGEGHQFMNGKIEVS